MTKFDRQRFETVFLPRSIPTFAACIERIQADEALSADRRRDLASGLRRVADALQRDPAMTPADPAWLQPKIAAISPAGLDLSPKSWANILSNARAALAFCGIVQKATRLDDLSPLWAPVWHDVLASGELRVSRGLGRLVRFLDNLDVAPAEVTIEHAILYRAALEINELHRSPEESMRQAVRAWNIALDRIPGWPGRPICLSPRGNRFCLPLDRFPEGLQEGVARFRRRLEARDLLDPETLPRPLRPATVRHRVDQLRRFASAVVHAGVPISALTSITELLNLEYVRRGLQWLLARQADESSPGLSSLCELLVALARHHADIGAQERASIEALAERLHVAPCRGMTEKNRTRLRQFDNPGTVGKLFGLADRYFGEGRDDGSVEVARKREITLAIHFLLHCPIRILNLTSIHLDRHIQRMRDGRVFFNVPPEEVKNRQPLHFELPAELVGMIDRHLATRAPRLCPAGTPWLFPRRDGLGAVGTTCLATRIAGLLHRDLGLTVNAHLFRHIAAMLWLHANPGQYEVARRLLGHSAVSSTIAAYADFNQTGAVQLYSEVLRKTRANKG
ncbi:hypothetical protein LHP98_18980 [Rhodobacter sp. Har01]|uniref:hypothetical protein n=1 Tax=Rhodobacter sp. Har01 TaxID=2883999 RepID=UPI001D0754E4|nr:hypothetical protein [Rhodobacter sp. Har01]MCB6180201.1 hypothetical protein [Rhodobacter sp. Har01]